MNAYEMLSALFQEQRRQERESVWAYHDALERFWLSESYARAQARLATMLRPE